MHLSKGDMPLTRNPDRIYAGVMDLGNSVPTTPGMSYIVIVRPGCPIIKPSQAGTIERLQRVRCVRGNESMITPFSLANSRTTTCEMCAGE